MAKETKVVELDEMVVSIEKSVPKKVDGKTRYNVMVNFNPMSLWEQDGNS